MIRKSFPKHCLQYGVLTCVLKENEIHRRPQSYQITVTKKAFAQVVIGALKVTKVSLYSIYSDPAFAQVVIGALKVAIYNAPASAEVVIGALKVTNLQ